MAVDFTDPAVREALVEAFRIGYIQGVEDCDIGSPYAGHRVNEENATLMFCIKLEESVEFMEDVKKYNPAGTFNIKLLEGDEDENRS